MRNLLLAVALLADAPGLVQQARRPGIVAERARLALERRCDVGPVHRVGGNCGELRDTRGDEVGDRVAAARRLR